MKKLATLGLSFSLFLNATANTTFLEDQLGKYALNFKGNVEVLLKNQEAYNTALDLPSLDVNARSGASERDEQTVRDRTTLSLSSGILGETTFFNYISVNYESNDPDDEQEELELEHAFVMWRPEIKGQRPFGLTVGQYSAKQTINAAYSNKFSGDFEDDFVAYSAAGVREIPMVGLDLHFSKNTAIGYSIADGSSDLTQIGVRYDEDYTRIHILWGETKYGNFGVNAAYQYALGARGDYTVNKIDDTTIDKDADYDYSASLFNTQLTYTINLNDSELIPFIGYQSISGEEAPSFTVLEVDWQNTSPEARDISANIKTAGAVYKSKLANKKVKFGFEYSDITTDNYSGLDGLSDGLLDVAVENNSLPDFAVDATGSTTYSKENGKFLGITGDSKAITALSGADAMYHIEASIDYSESLTFTLFYNGLIKTSVNTDATDAQIEAIKETLEDELGYSDLQASIVAANAGLLSSKGINSTADLMTAYSAASLTDLAIAFATNGAPVSTDDLAEYIADSVADQNASLTKWGDSTSIGLSVKYSF